MSRIDWIRQHVFGAGAASGTVDHGGRPRRNPTCLMVMQLEDRRVPSTAVMSGFMSSDQVTAALGAPPAILTDAVARSGGIHAATVIIVDHNRGTDAAPDALEKPVCDHPAHAGRMVCHETRGGRPLRPSKYRAIPLADVDHLVAPGRSAVVQAAEDVPGKTVGTA